MRRLEGKELRAWLSFCRRYHRLGVRLRGQNCAAGAPAASAKMERAPASSPLVSVVRAEPPPVLSESPEQLTKRQRRRRRRAAARAAARGPAETVTEPRTSSTATVRRRERRRRTAAAAKIVGSQVPSAEGVCLSVLTIAVSHENAAV